MKLFNIILLFIVVLSCTIQTNAQVTIEIGPTCDQIKATNIGTPSCTNCSETNNCNEPFLKGIFQLYRKGQNDWSFNLYETIYSNAGVTYFDDLPPGEYYVRFYRVQKLIQFPGGNFICFSCPVQIQTPIFVQNPYTSPYYDLFPYLGPKQYLTYNGLQTRCLGNIWSAVESNIIEIIDFDYAVPLPFDCYGRTGKSEIIMPEVYPNPATTEIQFKGLENIFETASPYTIYDITRKQMLEGTLVSPSYPIKVDDLPNGIYVINVMLENERIAKKFTVSR